MRSLCKMLARLVHLWWTRDRIRIAPGEGRLLRLEPGWLVAIGGEVFEVERRVISGPRAIYHCWTRAGPCELRVCLTDVVLRRRDRDELLAEEDVEVFPPR